MLTNADSCEAPRSVAKTSRSRYIARPVVPVTPLGGDLVTGSDSTPDVDDVPLLREGLAADRVTLGALTTTTGNAQTRQQQRGRLPGRADADDEHRHSRGLPCRGGGSGSASSTLLLSAISTSFRVPSAQACGATSPRSPPSGSVRRSGKVTSGHVKPGMESGSFEQPRHPAELMTAATDVAVRLQ